jgi:hypothetical protein
VRRIDALKNPIAILLAALLAMAVYVGNVAWWLDQAVAEQETFVDATIEALGQETSRDAMGQLIAQRLVDEYPLLVVVESNLTRLFSDLLATPSLSGVLTAVSIDIQQRLVTGDKDAIIVDLLDYRNEIMEPVEAVAPTLAELVPDEWFDSVEVLEEGVLPDVGFYARWSGRSRVVFAVAAGALMGVLLWFQRRRGMGSTLVGVAFVLASFATAIGVPGAKAVALWRIHSPPIEVILSNTYDQFTTHLKVSALVIGLIGVGFVALGVAIWAGGARDDSPGR